MQQNKVPCHGTHSIPHHELAVKLLRREPFCTQLTWPEFSTSPVRLKVCFSAKMALSVGHGEPLVYLENVRRPKARHKCVHGPAGCSHLRHGARSQRKHGRGRRSLTCCLYGGSENSMLTRVACATRHAVSSKCSTNNRNTSRGRRGTQTQIAARTRAPDQTVFATRGKIRDRSR